MSISSREQDGGTMRELSIREKLTRGTLIQSAVLGLAVGPLVYVIQYHDGSLASLAWCVASMAAAPVLVDALLPTYVRE